MSDPFTDNIKNTEALINKVWTNKRHYHFLYRGVFIGTNVFSSDIEGHYKNDNGLTFGFNGDISRFHCNLHPFKRLGIYDLDRIEFDGKLIFNQQNTIIHQLVETDSKFESALDIRLRDYDDKNMTLKLINIVLAFNSYMFNKNVSILRRNNIQDSGFSYSIDDVLYDAEDDLVVIVVGSVSTMTSNFNLNEFSYSIEIDPKVLRMDSYLNKEFFSILDNNKRLSYKFMMLDEEIQKRMEK